MMNKIQNILAAIDTESIKEDITSVPMGDADPQVSTVMGWVFILVVAVATIVVILSGIKYITSGGDPQKVSSAKNSIIYAVVGIVVAALATSIVRYVGRTLS